MKFKIDTKEIFHVISIEETELSANMAGEICELIEKILTENKKNIILDLKKVEKIDPEITALIKKLQQEANTEKRSFVICSLSQGVKKNLLDDNIMELINYAPTESEAWDIVQMEEIERELDTEI